MQDKAKIASIAGASRGSGKSTALALAKKGIGVIVTYINGEAEANVVSKIETMGGKAVALQLDTGNIKTFDDSYFSKGGVGGRQVAKQARRQWT